MQSVHKMALKSHLSTVDGVDFLVNWLMDACDTFNQNIFNIEYSITKNRCAYHHHYYLVWYGMFDGWLNANEVHGHDEINANKVMTVWLATKIPVNHGSYV